MLKIKMINEEGANYDDGDDQYNREDLVQSSTLNSYHSSNKYITADCIEGD